MKGITIPQPWAWALLNGVTPYWSVRRPVAYRGLVAIVSGVDKRRLIEHFRIRRQRPWWKPARYLRGSILGIMHLLDCRPAGQLDERDEFADGPYCLHLVSPEIFNTPVPYRGRSGLFEIPDALIPKPTAAIVDGKMAACGHH